MKKLYLIVGFIISMLGLGLTTFGANTTNLNQVVNTSQWYTPLGWFGGLGIQGGFLFGEGSDVKIKSHLNGKVYVLDSLNNRFQIFSSEGSLLRTIGNPGSGDGQFRYGSDITIDTGGNVYITDSGNHRIQKFNSDGEYVSQFGSYGSRDGEFNQPSKTTIDKNGYLYITDSENHRIQKFNSDGEYVSQFGSYGSGDGEFDYPSSITIGTGGNVYIKDGNNGRIQIFNSSGSFLRKFGSPGTGDGEFVYIGNITIDTTGNLYIPDNNRENNNYRIQKFNSSGSFLRKFGSPGTGDGQFGYIGNISIDTTGNLYIPDNNRENNNYRIQKFDSDGEYISQFGSYGPRDGEFSFISDIINNNLGKLYIADNGNNRIQITDLDGNYIGKFNGYTSETQGKLRYPNEAKIYNDKVYVPDTSNNRIQIYSLSGTYISGFGTQGSINGQFQYPSSIAINTGGILYVADTNNDRIQRFNSSGTYLGKFGSLGTGNGQFVGPYSIVSDNDNNIYVIDTTQRIQKFNSSGTYLSQFGSLGTGNGQFDNPLSIAIGSGGIVYVADTNNDRIQRFNSSGTYLGKFGSYGTGNGQFISLYSIVSDNDNNIYVTDTTQRVQKFNNSGNYITEFNVGFAGGKLGIDTLNNTIYITNTNQSTISRYLYTIPTIQPIIKSYGTGQNNPILTGIAGLSGDIITIYSGSSVLRTGQVGSGNMRTLTLPVTLSTGSIVFPWKLTDSENNSSLLSTLTLIIDTIAPIVTLSDSSNMTVNHNSIFVDPGARWTDAIDGSGSIMTGTASGNILNTSVIGTYYLKYTYTDRAGNTGNTVTRTISVVPAPTPTPSGSSGGGGGGGGLVIDNCPINEDYSPSYYDGTCGTQPAPIIPSIPQSIADITTSFGYPRPLPIVNRSTKNSIGSKSSSCDTYREDGYSEDLYNSSSLRSKDMFVICWMFDNKMTNTNNLDSFQGSNLLRRDASTKFFYNFITNVLLIDPITINTSCSYNDLKDSKVDLLGYIKQSCNIGIYKGSDTNKSFFPRETFKKGRFSIVMSNVITLYNTDASKPSLNSIKELQNKDARITRIEAAHALYKLSQMI